MSAANNPHLHRHFDRAVLHLVIAQRSTARYRSASFYDRDDADIAEAERAMNDAADELRKCLKQLGK